jgi:16S rRNA processing protein RimM
MTEQRVHPSSNPAVQPSARVCVAAVAGAHGVMGLVRLKPFTEVPEDCVAYGPLSNADGSRIFKVKLTGQVKGMLLARLDGVANRNQAEAMRGTRLYVERSALPETDTDDEFYHADLIGLPAMLQDGTVLGRVQAVYNFGAGDTLELTGTADGKPLLVPFTLAIVPEVDIANGHLIVEPPEGLLDGGMPEGEGEQ